MKKTIFVLSTLTLILAGCDSAEKTTQVDGASQQEVVDQSTTPAEHATVVVTASEDDVDNRNLNDQANDMASTQPANSNWQGTYTGVLPCADCDGIKTTLTLNKDETYQLEEIYQGKEDGKFTSTGAVNWDGKGSVVTLINDNGSDPVKYTLGKDGSLTKLGPQGEAITGDLAALYKLNKKN